MAASQLAGVGNIVPIRADTTREAANAAATQLVHGYFDRRQGALHFEFQIESSATHQMRALPAEGDALKAADAVAKFLDPAARPFSSQSLEAIQAWAERNFERATQIDPEFGTAWRDWLQTNPSPELAAKATSRSPIEKAEIQFAAAQIRRDAAAVGPAALALGKLLPKDGALLRRLAEQVARSRESVELYRAALALDPGDKNLYNQLGYAQYFAGDLAGARKSFDEYTRAPGQEANGNDSQGEVLFMAGEFAEAQKYFRQAHQLNATMLDGGDLLKAAYAQWFGGDRQGADSTFAEYVKYRSGRGDNRVELLKRVWTYATGREKDFPEVELARSRLAGQDLRVLEQAYWQTAPAADGLVRVTYAKALLKAGRRAEAETLAARWPLPETNELPVQAALFPLYLELKKDLGQ